MSYATIPHVVNSSVLQEITNNVAGVYRIESQVSNYINVGNVVQLHSIVEAGGTVVLGANNSLTDTMEFFYKKATQEPQQFGYLKSLADHIDLIANVPVRNVSKTC